MTRLSKPRLSDEQAAAQRLARADVVTRAAMTAPLAGVLHKKKLSPTCIGRHNRTKDLWRKFLRQRAADPTIPQPETPFPAEIVPGAKLPGWDIVKEFVRYLGYTLQGKLDEYVVKTTMRGYIFAFYALWGRYAYLPVPKEHRLHIMSYFESPEFDAISKLSTKSRAKPTADIVDVATLIMGILQDDKYVRLNRTRYNMTYAILIAALSSERPGALVESSGWRGSNEALMWEDHEFWIVPTADPYRPAWSAIVSPKLLKGKRDDDSAMKHFFIVPEPPTHRHVDALMYATVGAFQDKIFQDVDVIEDALHPKHPCTKAHRLRIKESARKQAVFRKEVYNGEKWVISDTLALPYHCAHGLMRLISLFLGYILWFTFFCFRRCSASNMSATLSEDDRRQMMGHNPNSDMFFERYQSRLGIFDLGAMLAGRLEDEDNIALMKNLRGMSRDRDPNAPIALTAAQHNELHADEELVEFRVAKVGLQARLKQEITKLSSLDDDADDEILAQKEVIDGMRNEIRTIDRKHCAIVSRETDAMIQASRKTYFEEASMRVLQGIEPIKRIPLAATRNVPKPAPAAAGSRTGQENLDPSAPTPARPTRVPRPASQLTPMQEALRVLAHFTPTDTITEHFIASVNALLGLPDRPSKHCYPGENPTHDNKCPVCNVELIPAKINKGGHNTATHVHTCLMKQFRKEVQTEAESDYEPVACNWEGCKKKGLWPTRAEFCRHVAIHLGNLQRSIWSRGTGVCRWRGEGDAAECGVYNDPNTLELHFAQMHELNVNETIDVEYCVICADVIIDWEGSGVWAMHCEDHYVELFLPFAERVEGEVEFSDDDLLVCAAVDHAVQFENGSGFAGKRPEFHGHIETQVPVAPMFCPLCVYDDTRNIAVRMRQFERNQDFQSHLDGHRKDILNSIEETQQCRVPSCGTHHFTPHNLLQHYVMFHRVPICGSTKHTNLRRLRLPAIAEDDDEADAGDDAAEMEVDVVVGVTVGARGVEVNAEASTSGGGGAVHANAEASTSGGGGPGAVVKRKRRRYTASNPKVPTTHYCNLCRLQFVDIREHLPGPCGQQRFKIKDKDVPRTQYGPWHNLAEWSLTAPPFVQNNDNDDSDDSDDSDSEAKPSKKVRAPAAPSYQCCGCNKSYSNIAKHFAMVRKPKSKCKLERFRVRDKDASWSRPTTLAAWKAAAGSVTVPDLDPSPSSSP